MQEKKRLLKASEAADFLGCSTNFLAKSRMANYPKDVPVPPYVRIGRRGIRYDLVELEKFVAQHSVNAQQE